MPKAKKFIDRKNAVTFHLVHRSQRDPLVADENAPQHVLVEAKSSEPVQRKEEQIKYGVFYDDDYDYMQHLRDTSEASVHWAPAKDPSKPDPEPKEKPQKKNVRINLPSSVFASEFEEDVGLLNKAAPRSGLRLDLDPDVVAAMDEDFNYDDPDNLLEDNFMELAMKTAPDNEEGEEEDDYSDEGSMDSQRGYASDDQYPESEDFEDEVDDEEGGDIMKKLRGYGARRGAGRDEDGKSRFSQYSMSSSVIRRNQGLTLLDDKFEKMFAEYDDTEIGALECDDIEGHLEATPDVLLKCAQQFEDNRRLYKLDTDSEIKKIVHLRGIAEEDETEPTEEELFGPMESSKPKWDCESIISTYSNLYNHPKLIEEPKKERKIKISAKTGIPKNEIDGAETGRVTMKSLAKLNLENAARERGEGSDEDEESVCESMISTLSILSLRPKDETPDERKERKRLLKKYREERRIEKKANTQAFKEEKKRQDKICVNNRQNIQGIKII